MTTNYVFLGSGTTDSNGVAKLDHDANGDPISHSYTGSGVGEVDVVASLDDPNTISDSSLQSETYGVTDAKAMFNGVSYVTSQGNIVDNGDGTYTIYPNPNNYCLFGFNSTTAQASGYFADIGGAFEFDVVSYTGAITLRNNTNGGSNFNVNTIWDNNTHYKIEIIDNGVKFNGTVKTASDTGARSFALRLEDGASITIKNLLYY